MSLSDSEWNRAFELDEQHIKWERRVDTIQTVAKWSFAIAAIWVGLGVMLVAEEVVKLQTTVNAIAFEGVACRGLQ